MFIDVGEGISTPFIDIVGEIGDSLILLEIQYKFFVSFSL
jgi:hypothetical protein